MTLRFTGDFKRLESFTRRVEAVPSSLQITSAQLAEETIDLIKGGFELAEDPDGNPWAPLVLREGRPLQDSGGLKASWHRSEVSPDGFTVSSGKDYAVYHQQGTGIHGPRGRRIKPVRASALRIPGVGYRSSVKGAPARRMVPDAGRIPQKWRDRYVATALEVLTELFEKRTA